MSDRPIQVGDLVMVVKPKPCGCVNALGVIFRVAEIDRSSRPNWCRKCGRTIGTLDQAKNGGGINAPLVTLKRLDPDALKEDVPADERLKERA